MNLAVVTNLLIVTSLMAIMFSMGLKVTFVEVISSVKQSRLVFFALMANFVLVPLVTLGFLRAFGAGPMVSVGFVILAVCPGAPVGPPFTGIARGNVSNAIGLMVILAGLSAVLAPLLLTILVPRFMADSGLTIDYVAIVRSLLLSQMLPLAVGLAVHRQAPSIAARAARPAGALANVLLLVGVVLILVTQYQTLSDVRPRAWLAMLLLLAASLVIGWLCGGPMRETRKALALTTALRNVAVGLVIASTNFPGTPAVTAVVAFGLVCILGSLGCALLFKRLPNNVVTQSQSS